jgi:hypothetical protein
VARFNPAPGWRGRRLFSDAIDADELSALIKVDVDVVASALLFLSTAGQYKATYRLAGTAWSTAKGDIRELVDGCLRCEDLSYELPGGNELSYLAGASLMGTRSAIASGVYLDGTLLSARLLDDESAPYYGRHGLSELNAIVATDFTGLVRASYIVPGARNDSGATAECPWIQELASQGFPALADKGFGIGHAPAVLPMIKRGRGHALTCTGTNPPPRIA